MRHLERIPDQVQVNKILILENPDYYEARDSGYQRRIKMTGKSLPFGSFAQETAGARHWYELLPLNGMTLDEINPNLKLRDGDVVCRCTSERMEISQSEPLVKFNLKYNMIYFMTNDTEGEVEFETKGNKFLWLRLRNDFEKFL